MNKYVFGIDLGTTNSALAAYTGGIPETVLVKGGRTIPSVVWFKPDGTTVVGQEAYRRKGSPDVVYSSKRDMGTDTVYHLTLEDGSKKDVTPIEVAAEVLKAIVKYSDKMYGDVEEAVVTVPAYFNDAQRAATRKAVELSGIKLINMINEPTAAALAYGVDRNENYSEKIIVTDVGGGTTDITLMMIYNYKSYEDIPLPLQGVIEPGLTFDVIATGGNNRLGGDDYDEEIINTAKTRLLGEASSKSEAKVIRDYMTVETYKPHIEQWKKMEDTIGVNLTCTVKGEQKTFAVNNSDKEIAFVDFWKDIDECVENTMNVYKVNPETGVKEFIGRYSSPETLIPVGGSTKNPLLLEAFKAKFKDTGMKIPSSVFADEAVALGAAINAAITKGIKSNVTLKEINPIPIGLETVVERNGKYVGGVFMPVIPKDITIPIRKYIYYATAVDNQEVIDINVYQGLSSLVSGNQFIGTITVDNLPKKPAGEVVLAIFFEIDLNGMLKVTATLDDKEKTAKFNSVLNTHSRKYSKADENKIKYLLSVRDYMESIGETDTADYSEVVNWTPGKEFPKYAVTYRKEINKFINDKINLSLTNMFTVTEETEE